MNAPQPPAPQPPAPQPPATLPQSHVLAIEPVPHLTLSPHEPLRVAGYCRTSTALECQRTSIEAQRAHYRDLIQAHPGWKLVDIYWEVGVSATSASARPELQRLISDCRAGRIDLVVTKSISRFARNTCDCLELTRSLAALGVTLRFDKENIQTDRMESELMLAILSALAQDESRSLSGNMKWAIRRRFEAGTYLPPRAPYGYRKRDGRIVVHSAEAIVVRAIFGALINGRGATAIASALNARHIPTWSQTNAQRHTTWRPSTVRDILKNPFYTGDAVFQKSYVDETYCRRKNTGQLKQYLHVANHPAIVDHATYAKANALLTRRTRTCDGESATRSGGTQW